MKKIFSINLFVFYFVLVNLIFPLDAPYLTGRVNDYANILTLDQKNRIEQILKTHEDTTTNQIVVLIITTLEDENLEEFTNRVFNTWNLGQKDKNNGVLLLIAIKDRKLRIEVGYGLEGYLTDAICSSIIRNDITPLFRQENYAGGIEKGVLSIISAIEGSYTATEYIEEDGDELGATEKTIIGLFVFSILGIFTLAAIFTKGCGSWFLFIFLIPFYAAFPSFLFGFGFGMVLLVCYIIVFILSKIFEVKLREIEFLKPIYQWFGQSGGRGWSSGSDWSSGNGSSWSSGSSSSFSGGGGSSGGGGASGGW